MLIFIEKRAAHSAPLSYFFVFFFTFFWIPYPDPKLPPNLEIQYRPDDMYTDDTVQTWRYSRYSQRFAHEAARAECVRLFGQDARKNTRTMSIVCLGRSGCLSACLPGWLAGWSVSVCLSVSLCLSGPVWV